MLHYVVITRTTTKSRDILLHWSLSTGKVKGYQSVMLSLPLANSTLVDSSSKCCLHLLLGCALQTEVRMSYTRDLSCDPNKMKYQGRSPSTEATGEWKPLNIAPLQHLIQL